MLWIVACHARTFGGALFRFNLLFVFAIAGQELAKTAARFGARYNYFGYLLRAAGFLVGL
jgi:hypothetical protein